jgi:aminopeptidase N
MAHMWFGNLVTMRWWDDLWLNESFATYMGYRLTDEVTRWRSWTRFGVGRKTWGYAADQRPSTHPVAPSGVVDTDDAFNNFDGISYAKGCSALRQLVAWIGDDAFFGGLRSYFDKHAWGNANLADLLGALSEASGRDIDAWAQLWLRSPGVNTLRPVPGGIEQTGSPLRPHRIGVRRLADGERTEIEVAGAFTALPEADQGVLLNSGDLTFAKVRVDDATRASFAQLLGAQGDSLERAVMWNTAWDSARDGEWPAAEFVALVEAALPNEPEVTIVDSVFNLARGIAVPRMLMPDAYDDGMAALARAALSIVEGSEPGGTRQLAGARGFVSATTDAALLRGWLDETGVPQGLVIDADLRWSILCRLAVLGAVDGADIEAELVRDNSGRGQQEATRAHASLPDPAAKARAFDMLITEQGLSNRIIEYAGYGLWQPEHAALTESYVERFFTEVPLSPRSGDFLRMIGHAGYPIYAVSENTLAAAERALAGDLHPQLRRSLVDETDDLRRALKAREASRSA